MKTEETADSRGRILSAATRLMSEHGYSGTSISMITKASGLPASSTYWHFGSKEQLLAAVLEHAAMNWLRSLPRWQDMEGTAHERFHSMLMTAASEPAAASASPFLRLLLMIAIERGPTDDEVMQTIRRVRTQVRRSFAHSFRELHPEVDEASARDVGDRLARFALAVADGVSIAMQVEPDTDMKDMYALLEISFVAAADTLVADRWSWVRGLTAPPPFLNSDQPPAQGRAAGQPAG